MGAKRRQPAAARSTARRATQTGPVEWATVGWMLAALTAAACLLLWSVVRAVGGFFGPPSATDGPLRFSGLILFAALVSGLVNLVLAAVVHRLRTAPAPRPILAFSLAVGLLPLLLVWLA